MYAPKSTEPGKMNQTPASALPLPKLLPKPLAYTCLALSMATVGCYVAFSKSLVLVLPVLLLAWLRFGIASVAMFGWLRPAPGEPAMTTSTKRLVFFESFFGNFLFSICMLYGVSMTSAVSAGIIMAGIPAVVALMGWLFLGERISWRTGMAIVCAVAGVALLANSKTVAQPSDQRLSLWGDLLVLGAVLCEASYAVIGKKLAGHLRPKRIAALINLWGFALMTPFGLWLALSFDFHSVRPGIWLLLVLYSLAASVAAVWLWMTGTQSVPASQAGIFTVMLPVSAVLTGVLVFGEPLLSVQLAALGLALLGVVLATFPSQNPSKPPP